MRSKISSKLMNSIEIPNTVAGVRELYNALTNNLSLIKDEKSGQLTANPAVYGTKIKEVNDAMKDLYDLVPLMRRKEEAFELYKTSVDEKSYKDFKNTSRMREKFDEFQRGVAKHHETEAKKAIDEGKKMADDGKAPREIEDKTGLHQDKIAAIFANKKAIEAMSFDKGIRQIIKDLNSIMNPNGDPNGIVIKDRKELQELLEEMANDDDESNDAIAEFISNKISSLKSKSKNKSKEKEPQPPAAPVANQFSQTPSESDSQENEKTIDELNKEYSESNKFREAFNKLAYLAMNYAKSWNSKGFFMFKDLGVNSKAAKAVLDYKVLKPGAEVKLVVDNDYDGNVYTIEGDEIKWSTYRESLPEGTHINDVIPIRVVYNGETIGYLHDINFMNPDKIVESYDNDGTPFNNIEAQRAAISEYRRQVIQSGGALSTKIKSIGFGSLIRNKDAKGAVQLNTREAFPNKEVEITIVHDNEVISDKKIANKLEGSRPVAVIPVYSDADGNVHHLVVPISPKQIDATQAKLISRIASLFIKNFFKNEIKSEEKVELDKSAETISKYLSKNNIHGNGNFNVRSIDGLRHFMALVIHAKQFEKGFSSIKSNMDSSAPSFAIEASLVKNPKTGNEEPVVLIGIGESNAMRIYKIATVTDWNKPTPGLLMPSGRRGPSSAPLPEIVIYSKNNDDSKFEKEPNMNIDDVIQLMSENMNGLRFNANRMLIGQKVPIPTLSDTGDVIFPKEQDYSEVIADNTTTNLLGVNIGTEEKPNYIYTVQRVIELDNPTPIVEESKPEQQSQKVDDIEVKRAEIEKEILDLNQEMESEILNVKKKTTTTSSQGYKPSGSKVIYTASPYNGALVGSHNEMTAGKTL
jgi:hypothetical protein